MQVVVNDFSKHLHTTYVHEIWQNKTLVYRLTGSLWRFLGNKVTFTMSVNHQNTLYVFSRSNWSVKCIFFVIKHLQIWFFFKKYFKPCKVSVHVYYLTVWRHGQENVCVNRMLSCRHVHPRVHAQCKQNGNPFIKKLPHIATGGQKLHRGPLRPVVCLKLSSLSLCCPH